MDPSDTTGMPHPVGACLFEPLSFTAEALGTSHPLGHRRHAAPGESGMPPPRERHVRHCSLQVPAPRRALSTDRQPLNAPHVLLPASHWPTAPGKKRHHSTPCPAAAALQGDKYLRPQAVPARSPPLPPGAARLHHLHSG